MDHTLPPAPFRVSRGVLVLTHCVGIAVTTVAWIVFLLGAAHLFVAAIRNHEGELGLGWDATVAGVRLCSAGLLAGLTGVLAWVVARRELLKNDHSLLT